MSWHLFGLVVTPQGAAANNRGETEGNISTLQKLLWNGDVHTTVSAEAIRWAIRYYWQRTGEPVNREWDEEANDHRWKDEQWKGWEHRTGVTYIDDDVLGFMHAEAAKAERGDEDEATPTKGKKRVKGTVRAHRGVLEVTRAISLTPFVGDLTFNARSGHKTETSLFGTEVHATRYQYGFALTPERLRVPERALKVVDAVVSLSEVAGNQSRFLYDFAPDSVLFRWTQDFAPRFLYGFGLEGTSLVLRDDVLRRLEARDIAADQLVAGGGIAVGSTGQRLRDQGATVLESVKAAAEAVTQRMKKDLGVG